MDKTINYSNYIIFIDESGDHGLISVDKDYPIFALVFVLIKKSEYLDKIIPDFHRLKYKYFGHDIRKEKGLFGILRKSSEFRNNFLNDLTELIKNSSFRFFASVIDKNALQKKYTNPHNPYEIAMLFCAEQSLNFLLGQQQKDKQTHLIIESRGNKEDRDLELEFRRICDNQSRLGSAKDFKQVGFELICSDKKSNSIGLQIADLIARPIGLSKLRSNQANRAYEVIRNKGSVKLFP